ncbi:hypothetical protein M5E87_08775 [Flavonifractor plautii]|nr:hypothetical protein M5E87_08775 [Flavonifractor plautii]
MEETVLREQLRTVDESLLFLLLIVLSVLLSYWGCAYSGRGCAEPSRGMPRGGRPAPGVSHPPERLGPGGGSAGLFLCLALKTERETARGGRRGPAVGVHQPVGLPVCLSRRPAAAGRPAGHPGCLGEVI